MPNRQVYKLKCLTDFACRTSYSENLSMKIGRVICALRKERNLTQEEVALSAGTDAGYLSRIERDERLPSLPLLENIAKSLGTQPSIIYAVAEELENPDEPKSIDRLLNIDFSNDALNLRLIFRELTKTNQRIAIELLRALQRSQP